ncbi:splicing regulator RBM11 isoform X1 [Manis pentadactyla]|uniref:splicing regulator RBM11 isoform X1 n=1 Tax=Manis pentadactyla TaxID=143292 RepID=UPI00255C479A|nr:splicing regulator RBM11 isoform X1 [Manis pentadactyla]
MVGGSRGGRGRGHAASPRRWRTLDSGPAPSPGRCSLSEGRGGVSPPSPSSGLERRDVPYSGGGQQDRVCRKFRSPCEGRDSLRAVPSGSSRSSEPANQSFESCVKINSHSYRNEEVVGRSSFPMQSFPINAALPQEYFFFQKMQWHAYNPALQLPCYEMTALLPNSTSVSSSLNHVPDLEAGPSSYEWTHQQPNDPDLYQMNKQKRQKQTSDSDSSTENNRGSEYSQKFQKCKKKKRY